MNYGSNRPIGGQNARQFAYSLAFSIPISMVGCSLLYDLSPTQCGTTLDCEAKGGAFSGTICENQICVSPSASGGGGGGDGDGQGGAQPECENNAQCINKALGSAAICRAGSCVQLENGAECPVVLGGGDDNENLIDGDPIVIGAYSFVDPISPLQSVATLNYDLAINEFNQRTLGGLPGGAGGKLRPVVAVVCSGTNSPDLELSGTHLIDDLGVPVILSAIYSQDLLKLFMEKGKPNGVLFLNPLAGDSTLDGADDDGLLWSMLGSGSDLAPILRPLVDKVERHVRQVNKLAPTEAVRFALVEAKTPFLADISDYAYAEVTYNGKSAKENLAAGTFLRVRVDSSLVVSDPDVSEAYASLSAFAPHVVLAMTSGEIVPALRELEINWNSGQHPLPFYVFSSEVFGNGSLADFVKTFASGRALGFNYAPAADTHVYDSYYSRLTTEYNVDFNLEGSENFYDATYFMLYALAAAASDGSITGNRMALALPRFMTGVDQYEVGPKAVGSVLNLLRQSPEATFQLMGAMGPPAFHEDVGARQAEPSLYCVDDAGTFVQGVARYDADKDEIVGVPPCVEGFPQ